jgi:hypothetical protein
MTTQEYAVELLEEHRGQKAPCPHRAAFVDALEARGQDARTRQFKHYDKIVKWMIANWAEELE